MSERDAMKPSRVRFQVLTLLCSLAFIFYLDRLCIGQAVTAISSEFGFNSNREMSYVQIAFTIAYGIFEIPTGRWGDRYGSKRVLFRIVIWFSIFTALTGASVGFWSILIIRFLFGAGEAGAYPNVARMVTRWFPLSERGRARGAFLASSLFGGAAAPLLSGIIIHYLGWRWMFALFGAVGVAWAIAFYRLYYESPAEHPGVNEAELQHITANSTAAESHHHPIPWRQVVRHPGIWILALIISLSSFYTYLFFSWYPTYLKVAKNLNEIESGTLTSMILLGAGFGVLLGGWVTDRIQRRARNIPLMQRLYCTTTFCIAAGLLSAGILVDNVVLSASLISLSCLAMLSQQSILWENIFRVSGKHLGAMFGLMNGLGGFGAVGSQFFFAWYSDLLKAQGRTAFEDYRPAFAVYVGALLLGSVCWLFLDTSRTVSGEANDAR